MAVGGERAAAARRIETARQPARAATRTTPAAGLPAARASSSAHGGHTRQPASAHHLDHAAEVARGVRLAERALGDDALKELAAHAQLHDDVHCCVGGQCVLCVWRGCLSAWRGEAAAGPSTAAPARRAARDSKHSAARRRTGAAVLVHALQARHRGVRRHEVQDVDLSFDVLHVLQ